MALFECFITGSLWLLLVLKCLKRAKKSLIFQKKYQMYTNFSYESIFCTSSMYEICLYFHWLYFSSIEFRTFMNIQTRKINSLVININGQLLIDRCSYIFVIVAQLYSCNNIISTLIQISRLFYFGFFSRLTIC